MHQLADWLAAKPASPLFRHRAEGDDIDALIDVVAVFRQTIEDLAIEDMPALLRPETGELELTDYHQVCCVDRKGRGDIFDLPGVHRARACMVVVRPEQKVAQGLPLDRIGEVSTFFKGIYG